MASDNGDNYAPDFIGGLYQNGLGVPQDYGQAMQWYRKAADLGDDEAEYDIGILYANGWGVPVDLNQANTWIKKAADADNDDAKKWLSEHGGAGAPMTAPKGN